MRRCRIVADAHNVVRRDAVCDVAALRFHTTNELTPQVHCIVHLHSRSSVVQSSDCTAERTLLKTETFDAAHYYFGSPKRFRVEDRSTVFEQGPLPYEAETELEFSIKATLPPAAILD